MKKSAAPILILVFLLVAVGIFVVFRISKNNASDTQNPGDDGDRNARTDGHDAPHGDAGADRDTCSDSRPDRPFLQQRPSRPKRRYPLCSRQRRPSRTRAASSARTRGRTSTSSSSGR